MLNKKYLDDLEQKTIEFIRLPGDSKQFCFSAGVLRFMVIHPETFPRLCSEFISIDKLRVNFPQTFSLLQSSLKNKDISWNKLKKRELKSVEKNPKNDEEKAKNEQKTEQKKEQQKEQKKDKIRTKKEIVLGSKSNQSEENNKKDEKVKDKVFFMLNNLSDSNYNETATFIDEKLGEQYHVFFAEHFISKVARERKFHQMYFKFYGQILNSRVKKSIVMSSYQCAIVFIYLWGFERKVSIFTFFGV